jgi:hypothetical protein
LTLVADNQLIIKLPRSTTIPEAKWNHSPSPLGEGRVRLPEASCKTKLNLSQTRVFKLLKIEFYSVRNG